MKNENDNIVYVHGPEEAAQNNLRLQKIKATKQKIMIACVVIAGVILLAIFVTSKTKAYKGYRINQSVATNYESTANYINFCDNLLKYTPDGVSYINVKGEIEWAAGIDMKMPVAVSSGTFAVVADLNGNNVCVFDSSGMVSNLSMPYTICDVDIADQGAFAVVLESQKTNYINLYNKNGEIIYEMQTTLDKSGYPLDISISDDGKKLFTSYINIGATAVENNLGAYNFGDVGQNSNADRMVGGYKFSNQIIPKLEFVNNDVVVGFGTNSIEIYDMKEKPSEKASIEYDKEVRSVFYGSNYLGIIRDVNAPEIEQTEDEETTVEITTEETTEETIEGLTDESTEETPDDSSGESTEETTDEPSGESTEETTDESTEETTEGITEGVLDDSIEVTGTEAEGTTAYLYSDTTGARYEKKNRKTSKVIKNANKDSKDESDGKYELIVYDLRGKVKFKKTIDFYYEKVYSNDDEIIVYGGDYCEIIRTNGSVKYSGTLSNTIVSIVPTGKNNQYVVVYGDRTDTITLKTSEGVEGVIEKDDTTQMDEKTTSTTVPTVVSTEKQNITTEESTEENTEASDTAETNTESTNEE